MLDFRIATFLQLCETRSYTKTAKLLDITQPSVTQHIKYLQRKYQCKLFSYEGKTLRLTPEGEYLRRQAEAMTKMSSRVTADLQRMSNKKILRFGCPKELGETFVARIVAEMLTPELEIHLCVKTIAELMTMLQNGQLDVVLTDKEYAESQFSSIPAGKMPYHGYASPEVCEAIGTVAFKKLAEQCLILSEPGSSDRMVLARFMERHNFEIENFQSAMICTTPACIQELSAAGKGICFGYASCMQDAVMENKLKELRISDFPEERTLVFLYSKDNMEVEKIKPFCETFKKNLK